MLAARDQENLVHARQTAAASKPLNQGTRQLQPKTPGNKIPKTPFRIPVNDENNPLAFGGGGKQTVRGTRQGNENTQKPGKDGLREKQPLATPGAGKVRAPLGMKTTNAKAFQTPAPQQETSKPVKTNKRPSTTRKLRQATPSPAVIQADHDRLADDDEDRDIEYMPPKPTPLPDVPDGIIYDTTFPQFKGSNLGRGWETLYDDREVGDDGLTRKEREEKEANEAYDKHVEELIKKSLDDIEPLDEASTDVTATKVPPRLANIKTKRSVDRAIPTIKSRTAAGALALQPRKAAVPVKPRASAIPKTRLPSVLAARKKTPPPSNPSSMRHTAAVASSKTTLGYSKGRKVSSVLRQTPQKDRATDKPPSNSILSPERYMMLYGEPPFGSEMWLRCKAAGCFDPEPDDAQDQLEVVLSIYQEDEESANFQLTL